MLIIAILILMANISLLAGAGVVYVRSRTYYREISRELSEFVTPKGQNEYSDLNRLLLQVGDIMGERIGSHIQMAARGAVGGSVKGMNAGLEQIAKEENPELAVIDYLPKSMRKNPMAMMGLQALISRMGGIPGSGGSRPDNGGQAQFRL